jgi:hypothetical protein
MKIHLSVLAILTLGLAFLQPAFAEKHDARESLSISKIDLATNTIDLARKDKALGTVKVQSYTLDSGVTVTIKGVSASISDLHKGQGVVEFTESQKGVIASLDVK